MKCLDMLVNTNLEEQILNEIPKKTFCGDVINQDQKLMRF